MPKTLTQAAAAQHLDRAWVEAKRLQERLSMRSMAEKKRVGVLQKVIPKLTRLSEGRAGEADVVSAAELAVLDALAAK